MLADQGNGARPRWQGVERLGERHADHRANRVARAAGPAGGLQLSHKLGDLRAVEQPGDLYRVRARWYRLPDHGGAFSWSRPPAVSAARGSLIGISYQGNSRLRV